ncbi:maleylacetoacetate isomerase [Photobacterium aphoticum]|uniref:Maleylacetoacetate isomerase n=1 Tax=Photobacterium aphoticum TaxID=754436 RepID=A0A0J1GJB7_9GAMM|nr:maleylacetoacetate isomerase [Photobacterium aphoticum]KLU99812.1 maleylacetoacetate isomerase [Photobacterium aphoticum]PSU59501.1 maleylacetoacetate isomerase [Photobacterium aphoticum]GHA40223.1 maleylacetoacetate isomerase [Photobacterium aphoticum]
MKLYDYYRSSAAYRVRIALNIKQAHYQSETISLLDNDQNAAAYSAINPHRLVPGFSPDLSSNETSGETCDETHNEVNNTTSGVLGQSLAIIEYLDERYPEPPLLPHDLWQKARCREMALTVACDIHPLNNLRVLNYLNTELGVQQNEKMIWYHHWLARGFQTLEALVSREHASRQHQPFCCGDTPTMADLCLIPQLYNAKRFGFDTRPYHHLVEIEQRCLALPAFIAAHPDNVSDS